MRDLHSIFRKVQPDQERWRYMMVLQEQVRWIHKTFHPVIDSIVDALRVSLLLADDATDDDMTSGEPVFTNWCYNPEQEKCIETDNIEEYHPICYCIINDSGESYHAYIKMRDVSGMTDDEKLHDPIIVYINMFQFRQLKSPRFKVEYLIRKVPSMLAHEFGHAIHMWSEDYEEIVNELQDFGYTAVDEENLSEYGISVSKDEKMTLTSILYFMSPEETFAKLEQYYRWLSSLSASQISHEIEDAHAGETQLDAVILFFRKNMLRSMMFDEMTVSELKRFVHGVAKSGDFKVPLLLAAFEIELGFIVSDVLGHGDMMWTRVSYLIGHTEFIGQKEIEVMLAAYRRFRECFYGFASKLYDITEDVFCEKGVSFERKSGNMTEDDWNRLLNETMNRMYDRCPERYRYSSKYYLDNVMTAKGDWNTVNETMEPDLYEGVKEFMFEMDRLPSCVSLPEFVTEDCLNNPDYDIDRHLNENFF